MVDPLDRDPRSTGDTDVCAPERFAEQDAGGCANACRSTQRPAESEGAGGASEPPLYSFDVQGLCCAQEVGLLKQEVGPVVGGADKLAFDVLKGRMMVLHGAGNVSAETVRRAVRRTGMTASDADSGAAETDRARQHRMQTILTALSGVFLVLGVSLQMTVVPAGAPLPWFVIAAYALSVGCGGRYVAVKALYAAKLLRADINLLMVIAVAGAIAIGEWFEAATVAFLFALSLLLESWSVARARRAVEALLDLAPQTVRLCAVDGSEPVVDAGTVAVGSGFVVKPGERIPLDGVVRAGSSWVDQAPITGERSNAGDGRRGPLGSAVSTQQKGRRLQDVDHVVLDARKRRAAVHHATGACPLGRRTVRVSSRKPGDRSFPTTDPLAPDGIIREKGPPMTREAPGDVQPSGLHRISNDNLNVDPYGLVSAVLHERSAPADGHSPRDCLINWLLDLPADLDPAVAARQLLTQRPDSPPSERADCMASLLAETAAHPRPHPDRRRRQRRQAVQQPRHDVGRHTTCVRSDGLEPRRGGRGS